MKEKKTKVIIPCRISYAHVWEGEPDDNGKDQILCGYPDS